MHRQLIDRVTELRPLSLYSTFVNSPNDDNNKIGLVTFRNLESLESVHFLDSQEVCLHFIWVHSEDLILYFCEVSKSLEFITF